MLPTTASSGVEVMPLEPSCLLPDGRISRLIVGQVESYRAKAGFSDPDLKPQKTTVALWCQMNGLEYKSHEFIVGGPALTIGFSTDAFYGLSGRDGGVEVKTSMDPSAIKFRRGSNVSEWKTLPALFPGAISTSAPLSWEGGPTILCRFRVRAERKANAPGIKADLVLEAMVLQEGGTFEGLQGEARQVLEKGACRTILLWKTSAEWFMPATVAGLPTTPGINLLGGTDAPTDPVIRWMICWILDLTRRGGHVTSAEAWWKYLKAPMKINAMKEAYRFIVDTGKRPEFKPTGKNPGCGGQDF